MVHEQTWQRKLISARSEDERLNFDGGSGGEAVGNNAQHIQGFTSSTNSYYLREAVERLCACQKTHTDTTGEVMCRLCNRALKVSLMSWLVLLTLHRTSTLPNITQP